MKFYSVYKKSEDLPEKCVLVKRGFSWKNFFFGVFWALYKKIWDLTLIHILVMLITRVAIQHYPAFNIYITTIAAGLQVLISFYANSLLEQKLISDGYEKLGVVAGSSEESALLRFLTTIKEVDNK